MTPSDIAADLRKFTGAGMISAKKLAEYMDYRTSGAWLRGSFGTIRTAPCRSSAGSEQDISLGT